MGATYEEAMTALRNADAAGDADAARRLARIAAQLRDQRTEAPAPPTPKPDPNAPTDFTGNVDPEWAAGRAPAQQAATPRTGGLREALGAGVKLATGVGVGEIETGAMLATGGTTGVVGGLLSAANNVIGTVLNKLGVPGVRQHGQDLETALTQGMQAGTYIPRTAEGQALAEPVGQALATHGPAIMGIGPELAALGKAIGTGVQGARGMGAGGTAGAAGRAVAALPGQAVPEAVSGAAARGARAVGEAAGMPTPAAKAAKAALALPELEGIRAAHEAGYKLTPKAAKAGFGARVAETSAGSARLSQELAAHNAENTARLARRDVGLPDDVPATPEATSQIRKEAGQDYAAIQDVGRFEHDAKYGRDLDRVVEPLIEASKDYPDLAGNPLIKRVEGMRKGDVQTSSAIEVVKDLRNEADKAFRAGDKKLGGGFRALAEAVDNSMDRALTKLSETSGDAEMAGAVDKYRAARKRIAKTYLLDDAMDGKPGEVNAKAYSRALEKGVKLDGDGLTIANFGKQFGDEGLAAKKGRSGSVGPTYHDIVLGALIHAPSLGATALARPLVRSALGSGFAQRRMAGSKPLRETPAPPAAVPEPEITTSPGVNVERPAAPEPGPLGDLTPDWETAPGAAPAGRPPEVVPTEGLVPAVDDAAVTTGRERGGLQMPVVPGRPDLPDVMVTGGPAEAAASEASNAAMTTPGAIEARRTQGSAPAAAASPAAPAHPRLTEIQRLKAATDSDVVRKALDEQAKGVEKEIAAKAADDKRRADVKALEKAAAATEDPKLRAALQAKADSLRTEKIPVGEATELATTPTPKPEKVAKIPVGQTKEGAPELPVAKPEKIPVGEATEIAPEVIAPEEAIPVGETPALVSNKPRDEVVSSLPSAEPPVREGAAPPAVSNIPAAEPGAQVSDYTHGALFKAAEMAGIETRGRRPSEVRSAFEASWAKEHGLNPFEAERAKAVAKAMDIDEKAVENAAVQHERSPRMFDKAIDQIIEQGEKPDASGPKPGDVIGENEDGGPIVHTPGALQERAPRSAPTGNLYGKEKPNAPETKQAASRSEGAAPDAGADQAPAEQPGANGAAAAGTRGTGDQPNRQAEGAAGGVKAPWHAESQAYMKASEEVTRLETALIDHRSDNRVKPRGRDQWLRRTGEMERELAAAKTAREQARLALLDAQGAPEPKGFEKGKSDGLTKVVRGSPDDLQQKAGAQDVPGGEGKEATAPEAAKEVKGFEKGAAKLNLWRKDPTSGLWRVARDVDAGNADQWLAIFRKDDPKAEFKVSAKKPASGAQAPGRNPKGKK